MKNLVLLFLLFICTNLFAQDCVDFEYYRNISIDNSTGVALTDYQVRVQLNTSQLFADGKLKADGADIRIFADDCTPLSFWGDSLGISMVTNIWVKIPSIPANGTSTFQIYYGNATAESVADGNNTFIFFDDFNANGVDLTKWETVGEFANLSIVDNVLNYSSTNQNPGARFKFVRTTASYSEETIFDFVAARSNSNGFGFSSAETPLDRILFRDSGFGFDTLNQVAYMSDTISNGFSVNQLYPFLRFDRNDFNTVSINAKINASNHLEINRFANEGLGDENTDVYEFVEAEMSNFHFILSSFGATQTVFLDNIRARQATPNPPLTTLGEEIFIEPNSTQSLIDPTLIQVFPNPADQHTMVKVDLDESLSLQITDAMGREIKTGIELLGNGSNYQLDLQELTSGIYFLHFHRSSDQVLLLSKPLYVDRSHH